jgi:hypothetical protein
MQGFVETPEHGPRAIALSAQNDARTLMLVLAAAQARPSSIRPLFSFATENCARSQSLR